MANNTFDLVNYIEELAKETKLNPELLDMVDILKQAKAGVKLDHRYMHGETNAEYNNDTNTITMNSFRDPLSKSYQRTLTHEVSHAVDNVLGNAHVEFSRNVRQGKATEAQRRYTDTYSKITPYRSTLALESRKKDGAVAGKYDDYRYRGSELRAFGVGNITSPLSSGYPVPDHIDATMATEAAIQRDMYRRAIASEKAKVPDVKTENWLYKLFN